MDAASQSLRVLNTGDEAALETFLARHAASSMFLRSNLRAAGFADSGAPYQACYAALLENGGIVAVAAHCWNNMLVLQAPLEVERVAAAAITASGRRVSGIVGPHEQVRVARQLPNLRGREALSDSAEVLFRIGLDRLQVPKAVSSGELRFRRAAPADHQILAEWRIAYAQETFRRPVSAELGRASRAEVEQLSADGALFVLETGGEPISCCNFNARLPDMVQVGGVFTPPMHRRRGFARMVVAGALKVAREAGATDAILFTGSGNTAAQGAYRGLGFEEVGDYGIVLFKA